MAVPPIGTTERQNGGVHPHRPENAALPWPPAEVVAVCDGYLAFVDEVAPDLVEGLYLHGSVGFREWYAGRSDIDFVAVLGQRPDEDTVQRLREVHERLTETFPRPSYDGLYLTWDDLAAPPQQCPDVPCTLGGEFSDEGRVDLNPVTWHELARHAVVVRGPEPEDLEIWTDRRALREYTHGNLTSYWAEQARLLARFPAEAARPDMVEWFVLGVPRLHHLLATDRLTSKNGAGHHAVAVFGERWRPLVAEALAHRTTGQLAGILPEDELAAQTIEFADLAVREGLALRP